MRVRVWAVAMVVAALAAAAVAEAHHRPERDGCKTKRCHARVERKQAVAKKRAVVAPYRSRLLRIAMCESGMGGRIRWGANTGNGHYGGLQFTASSWRWVGGRGLPHEATRLEQMYRAVLLMRRQGWGAWPVCSRRAEVAADA